MEFDNDRTVVQPGWGASRSANDPAGAPIGVNTLPPHTRLGEFEIINVIGEGGFGIVYLAYDHSLDIHVAVKEYMPSGLASRTSTLQVAVRSRHYEDTFTAGLKSFLNEARLLARFNSPSLVKAYRYWEENGTAYMVMPYYEGITLKQALKEGHIAVNEEWIRAFLSNILPALETIHREHCYHRDIAPDNILLLKNGQPLLLDFGAARRVIGDLTQGPTAVLKPGFAPIEQYGDIPGLRQGPWTDIYALAGVVYYMITGKVPPPAVTRVYEDKMISAREAGRGKFSDAFLTVIDRAMAVRPENRIQSVEALRTALGMEGDITKTLPPGPGITFPPPPPPSSLPPKRGIAARIALGLILVAGSAVAAFSYLKMHNSAPPDMQIAKTAEKALPAPGGEPAPQTHQDTESSRTPAYTPPPVSPSPDRQSAPMPAPQREAPVTADADKKKSRTGAGVPSASLPSQESRKDNPSSQPAPNSGRGKVASQKEPSSIPKPAPTPAPVPEQPRLSADEAAWLDASAWDTEASYSAYLGKFPQGSHAAEAKRLLNKRQGSSVAMNTPDNAPKIEPSLPPENSPPIPKEKSKPELPVAPEQKVQEQSPVPTPTPGQQHTLRFQGETMVGSFTPDPQTGLVSGTGTIRWDSGDKFEGTLVKGIKEGKGRFTWASGQMYNGSWSGDKPNGKGFYRYANGNTYQGDIRDGEPNGQGTTRFRNGDTYKGTWVNGAATGHGVIQFASGDRYEGEVRNGKQHGHGKYTWKNGSYWEGEFRDGVQTENGRLVRAESPPASSQSDPASVASDNAGKKGEETSGR